MKEVCNVFFGVVYNMVFIVFFLRPGSIVLQLYRDREKHKKNMYILAIPCIKTFHLLKIPCTPYSMNSLFGELFRDF